MIEDWIDTLCEVWRIAAPGWDVVRSPYLIREKKFPTAINPTTDLPIAITVPSALNPMDYGVASPKNGITSGVTEFHITPDLSRAHIPSLIPWPGLIWRAASLNMTLSGLVELFWIEPREDAILGPIELQYGSEAKHWGFIVQWKVKEPVGSASRSTIKISVPMPS